MKTFAFYLPQFYPTPENDEHWGPGFTEWTNCAKAKPLFAGHQQPKVPRDLGFYDLRLKESIREQAKYARSIGVDGWVIWHYWFGDGRQTLEVPTEIIRDNAEIDIDYFLCWVNGDWTKSWVGEDRITIFKQKYSTESYRQQYEYLRTFFSDSRYQKVDRKPILVVLEPHKFDCTEYQSLIDSWAIEDGYPGICWLTPAYNSKNCVNQPEFDYCFGYPPGDCWSGIISGPGYGKDGLTQLSYRAYAQAYKDMVSEKMAEDEAYLPTFMPNWDNTPRYGGRGQVFLGNTYNEMRELFGFLYHQARDNKLPFIFIKAWNEWAEGNYVEPDLARGSSVADAIGSIITNRVPGETLGPEIETTDESGIEKSQFDDLETMTSLSEQMAKMRQQEKKLRRELCDSTQELDLLKRSGSFRLARRLSYIFKLVRRR